MIMKMKKSIVIFGSGGHGKVVLDILLCAQEKVLGFLDDDKTKAGQKICGCKVLGGWEYLKGKKNIVVALGIGNNLVREKIFERARSVKVPVACAIHPESIVSRFVRIGEGVVIMAGAVINPGAILEEGVVVNTAASVDHDCHLKKFSHIWPGAHLAGTVTIGEYSYVGTGASVIQNINIGKNALIGAGAAVVKDISDNVTAVGVPARALKKKMGSCD